MKTDWKENGPIVIGGMGGSGTRLVAEICALFGIYLGDDLNIASDNLLYTLLFRRRTWFYKTFQDKDRIRTGLSLLEKLLLKRIILSPQELWFLLYAGMDMTLHYRDDKLWSFKRILNLVRYPWFGTRTFSGWGWKEPNSYLLLEDIADYFPNLKFIHTIRHGADMAFSKNQRQLRAWGMLFDIPHPEKELPESSLKFWAKANRSAAVTGKELGDGKYLQINFDRLCQEPGQTINDIIAFLGIDINEEIYQAALKLPKIPPSLGRYMEHDISQLDPEDLAALNEFGFRIEE
jgi:hypothetical protein